MKEKKIINTENIKFINQFIKDLSFENYSAHKNILVKEKLKYKIDLKIETKSVEETKYEVTLIFLIEAFYNNTKTFLIELSYAGTFEIQETDKERLRNILMIECAKFIYPFCRRIIYDISRDGGFTPIKLGYFNFQKLYENQKSHNFNSSSA